MDCAAFLILCGWLLYFRSVFSACASPGDLAFVLNGLNSLRYVDGVLALSEVYLALLLGRFALPLVAVNTLSRLALLYARLPGDLFPPLAVCAIAAVFFLVAWRRPVDRSGGLRGRLSIPGGAEPAPLDQLLERFEAGARGRPRTGTGGVCDGGGKLLCRDTWWRRAIRWLRWSARWCRRRWRKPEIVPATWRS